MRVCGVIAGVLCGVGSAAGQITGIRYIGPGSQADLNDSGQVALIVGELGGERMARYSDGVGVELISGLTQRVFSPRIGNSGQMSWHQDDGLSFRFTDGIGVEPLLLPGATGMAAAGINSHGTVTGTGLGQGLGIRAWTYGSVGPAQVLASLPPQARDSWGNAINDAGQVAGDWEQVGSVHAYRYTPGLGVEDLGTLGGQEAVARGINARGDVIGWSERADGFHEPYLYTDTGGMEGLGYLALHMLLHDINDTGWIAAQRMGTDSAMIWSRETGFVDLNELVPAGLNGRLRSTLAINNQNQAVVYGHTDGVWGVYRVDIAQLPAPGSLMLLGAIACLGCSRRRPRGR